MIPALLIGLLGFSPDRRAPGVQRVCATTTTSNADNTVDVPATGLSWTPPSASTRYVVRALVTWSAAASTTGLQGRLDPGDATGGCWGVTRGSSGNAFAPAEYAGIAATTSAGNVLGATSPATPGNQALLLYECVITSDATPTAMTFQFRTEVNTSAVTVQPGSCIEWEQIP